VDITSQVAKGLAEIVDKARQVDELVLEVTTASQEQEPGDHPGEHGGQPDGQGHPEQRGQRRGDRQPPPRS
jgi:hypothetical protein